MPDRKQGTCPFCSIKVTSGVLTCPNCGGFIPPSEEDEESRPSGVPGTLVQPSVLPDVSSFGARGGNPQRPHHSPGGGGSVFGSAPNMSPSWSPAVATSRSTGRNVVIGVVIAVVGVVLALGIGLAYVVSRTNDWSSGSMRSDVPPVPISVNQPIPGALTTSAPSRLYEFVITRPGSISVSVDGDFDNFLEIFYEDEEVPRWTDDDSGGNLNAQIFTPVEPGRYYAKVRPYSEGTTGSFTLTVTAPAEQPQLGYPPGYPTEPAVPNGPRISPRTYTGVVASESGPAPATTGSQCVIQITGANTPNSLNCRVRVICNGGVIYGRDEAGQQYGFNRCTSFTPGGGVAVIEAHDTGNSQQDGDPRIDLQTSMGQITVSDQGTQLPWSVTIRFTGPAAMNAPGTAI